MVVNTQIITVSVPRALCEFIENADLSPSEVIQEALIEKKHLWDKLRTEKDKLLQNIQAKDTLLAELISYLEIKNLPYEDFMEWRRQNKDNHDKGNAIL